MLTITPIKFNNLFNLQIKKQEQNTQKTQENSNAQMMAYPAGYYLNNIAFGLNNKKLKNIFREYDVFVDDESFQKISLDIQIAELAVSPNMLNEYLSKGVRVGLEKIVNDNVYILKDNKKFLKGKLLQSGGRFIVEILGKVENVAGPLQNMVDISIVLGSVVVPGYVVSELSQTNALWDTGLELTNEVSIFVDNKFSATANLASYDKQFAIEVK